MPSWKQCLYSSLKHTLSFLFNCPCIAENLWGSVELVHHRLDALSGALMTTREGLLYLVLSPYLAMYGGRPWSTRHCVRRGPSYPQKKRAHPLPPNFGPCLLWPNGWMDEDAAWYGSRPRLRPHCTRQGRSCRERGTAASLFSAHGYCGHGRPSQRLLSSCYDWLL